MVGTVEFEFRHLYRLTVHDPRYLESTVEEMLTDIWAHRFKEDPKLLEEIEDTDFDPDEIAKSISPAASKPPEDDWETL